MAAINFPCVLVTKQKIIIILSLIFPGKYFWRNVVQSWAEYVQDFEEARDLLSQPL